MATCNNPKNINTTNVNNFGFSTLFDPYNKTITIGLVGYTTYKTGGAANITSIVFTVTSPNNDTYTGTINPSTGGVEVVIEDMTGGQLYFGQYTVTGVLTEADASTYSVEVIADVCYDSRMNNANYIDGSKCLSVSANCANATLIVKEGNLFKYNGITTNEISYDGSITYPNNYQEQVDVLFLPYQLSLANSVTGIYQIEMATTALYDLGCGAKMSILYLSKVNKDVQCGAGMCDIQCCWDEALKIVERGGTQGALMEEQMDEALPYYVAADLKFQCAKNNDKDVAEVKRILNCNCQCTESVLIQPNPITLAGKNIIGACGTTVSTNEAGDITISSQNWVFEANSTKITVSPAVQTSACTKTITFDINCAEIEECLYEIISENAEILAKWQALFGSCPCEKEGFSIESEVELEEVIATPTFDVLEDTYVVKNQTITGVKYTVDTDVTGATLAVVTYQDQLIQNSGQVTVEGSQSLTIPTNKCVDGMIYDDPAVAPTTKLLYNILTQCGCVQANSCDLTLSQIAYTERYGYAYRFNPQHDIPPYIQYPAIIDGDPYTVTELIINDTYFSSVNVSTGGTIRSVKFKTDSGGITTFVETRTLMGTEATTPVTLNGAFGNDVQFSYNSGVVPDVDEVHNGYPVLYFATFGGQVCRAVRETCNFCDERKNWRVYVIYDGSDPIYGVKLWEKDQYGNRTILFAFADPISRLYILTFSGLNKNLEANWTPTNLNIVVAGANLNFQIDGLRIYILNSAPAGSGAGTQSIRCTIYSGANTIAALTTPANYTIHTVCQNVAASAPVYLNGIGTLASCYQPNDLFIDESFSPARHYFNNARSGSATAGSYLRYFVKLTDNPTRADDYEFFTEIQLNSGSNLTGGTWTPPAGSAITGGAATMSGESFGMVNIPNLGWISLYEHGLRLFNFTLKTVTVISGQAFNGGNLDSSDKLVDSQWEYKLECGGGSGSD